MPKRLTKTKPPPVPSPSIEEAVDELTDEQGLLIDQLVELWTPGWIPEALDSRTGAEA